MIGAMENQNTSNEAQELHATVRGMVQGVGFRYFVIDKALSLGLRGYTRNVSDGSVEVLAQGPRPALEKLLALLRRGPAAADVSEVEVDWRAPTTHVSGFHLRW
jgi:acylphosphatase